MDRILVVVFDNETKAYEGEKALLQLDTEGSISVSAHAVIAKQADGTVVVREKKGPGPIGTFVGTVLGSLIGMFGGPAGVAIGAASGFAVGGATDLNYARIGQDFIDDVNKQLVPNKVALVAEIKEDWTTPVDTRMGSIGGFVYRRALSDVKHAIHEENIAAMKADLAQKKAEQAKAHEKREKAKLQKEIDQLESKIQAEQQKAKDRRDTAERKTQAAEREAQAKIQALKAKEADLKTKAS